MSGRRILITGGTGFIGCHLIPRLIEEGFECAVVSRDVKKIKDIFNSEVFPILYCEQTLKAQIHNFNPNVVVHLASYSTSQDDVSNMKLLVDSNIVFLSVILDALKSIKVDIFINTGSFAEYYYNDGELNPAYYYAATKTSTRFFLKYFHNLTNMPYCHIIPYTVYGGNSHGKKVIDYVFDSLDKVEAIKMTSGEQILDFIYITDVVDFYINVIHKSNIVETNEVFHLGSGVGYSLPQLAKKIEQISGKDSNIAWGGLDYRPLDVMRAIAPIFKLKKVLKWSPTVSIDEGLKLIWKKKQH